MSSLMIEDLRKGNAIPLLLSRINKAKVCRGLERELRERKCCKRSPAWTGCLHGEESNTSEYQSANRIKCTSSLELERFAKFRLWSRASDHTGKYERSYAPSFQLVSREVEREGRGSDKASSVRHIHTILLLPPCMNKFPISRREGIKAIPEICILITDLSYLGGVGQITDWTLIKIAFLITIQQFIYFVIPAFLRKKKQRPLIFACNFCQLTSSSQKSKNKSITHLALKYWLT